MEACASTSSGPSTVHLGALGLETTLAAALVTATLTTTIASTSKPAPVTLPTLSSTISTSPITTALAASDQPATITATSIAASISSTTIAAGILRLLHPYRPSTIATSLASTSTAPMGPRTVPW